MRPNRRFLYISVGSAILCVCAAFLTVAVFVSAESNQVPRTANNPPIMTPPITAPEQLEEEEAEEEENPIPSALGLPMDRALERITKKPFGLEIRPGASPVENDRFAGFHVGVDYEIFENEHNIDVPVFAVCDGPLLMKRFANGYGGVAVQTCTVQNQKVSVIYGHLRLASITAVPNDVLQRGEQIAVLGNGQSKETDGVRKHLHLGIQTGAPTDIRGYVQERELINQWLDAAAFMSHDTGNESH